MNTYIVPIYDLNENQIWNKAVKARSYNEAQSKIMQYLTDFYDLEVPTDWNDFLEIIFRANLNIGELKDIEEF